MLRDKLKRVLKIEKALVENPVELLADIGFRFYKRFVFKDGGEGVERREKITIVIAITVTMIGLVLIVAFALGEKL